ncbi:MAG: YkgJ family cysteine cluster protein [Oxalobacteraceae bacterium]|nr:YkgJ family cysteine cluster protein [Oxalobacteraceae bacterium]
MSKPDHACREGCAACCIAPSISSPIPGMPEGKPAGVRCVQLDAALACLLFSHPDRPAVCASLKPSTEMCGDNREQALYYLQRLECLTAAGEGVTHEQGKFRADAQNSAVVG